MTCAFDDIAYDDVAFDVCVPVGTHPSGGLTRTYPSVKRVVYLNRCGDDEDELLAYLTLEGFL